jgi:predicted nucleotide-binding protein
MAEPSVFIGSSSEQLETARAIKQGLGSDVQAVVWDEADFALNESAFGALSKMAERFDFAVFVFDADDVAQIRRAEVRTVRDNVVFELGLFIGRLGRGRAFWITAEGTAAPHISTDLAGITRLT